MHNYFETIRLKIFGPSISANAHFLHIVFLLVLIVYPLMVDELGLPIWLFSCLLILFVVFSILLPESLDYKLLLSGVLVILYTLFYIEFHFDHHSIHYLIRAILILLFGVFLTYTLLKGMLKFDISLALLYQSVDCYLLIGVCFAYLFRIMHVLDPGAFNFPVSDEFNHLYLSFVVLTTLGLGDLLPLTLPTKAAVVLASTIGQIYLVFFAAMIVGKYIGKTVKDH